MCIRDSSVPQSEKGNIILFSAVRDKEYEAMIKRMCRSVQADRYCGTLIADRRAAEAGTLGKLLDKYTDRPVIVIESAEEALRYVLSHRGGRTVYCLGSLYLTGMIKDLIQEVISC